MSNTAPYTSLGAIYDIILQNNMEIKFYYLHRPYFESKKLINNIKI
jgi:hypothetical protein